MTNLQVSSASAWNSNNMLQLPSGKVISYKSIDIVGLMLANADNGVVPDVLTQMLQIDLSGGRSQSLPSDTDAVIKAKDMPGFAKFINMIVMTVVTEPRVVTKDPNYDDGQIGINDMTFDDKMAIFQVVMPNGEMAAASTFHQGQDSGVELVPNGADIRQASKRID